MNFEQEFQNHTVIRRARAFNPDQKRFEVHVGDAHESFLGEHYNFIFSSELDAQVAVNLVKAVLSDVDNFVNEFEYRIFGAFTPEQDRAQTEKAKLLDEMRAVGDASEEEFDDDEPRENPTDCLRAAIETAADVASRLERMLKIGRFALEMKNG